ncbi:hypothetical protein Amn_01990 [Aminobacter sp. Y103A]|nr:hypothetical protein Amn_01990 [Aminobacter sp. SS-2016]
MSGGAGWSSPVARQAHNLKVTGSNPVPATKYQNSPACLGCFGIWTQVTVEFNLHQRPARSQSRQSGTKSQILSPKPTIKARQGENHGGLFAVSNHVTARA